MMRSAAEHGEPISLAPFIAACRFIPFSMAIMFSMMTMVIVHDEAGTDRERHKGEIVEACTRYAGDAEGANQRYQQRR